MGRRAKPAKVKAEAKRPLARKAPRKEAPGIHELEKRLAEALEQQTATAEILKVISSSPTDIQPVLDAVAESAARFCGANDVVIRRVEGDVLRAVAHFGPVPLGEESVAITRGTIGGRATLERRTIHVHDIADERVRAEYPEALSVSQGAPFRTMLIAPLLREDTTIGVISMRRPDVRPFSDKQIKLLKTFADQAVIAIENVRLFNETKEALQQQTVISEILKIISSSPTDTQPVFDAIVKSGVHLLGGLDVSLRLVRGDHIVAVASSLPIPSGGNPSPLNDDRFVSSRSILRRDVVQVPDVLVDEEFGERLKRRAEQRGIRAIVCAPMLRENNAIGTINVTRAAPGPFTEKQIALLKTFADQAVIAIENVRLFNETKEALERQTATAEILKVISSSPTDVQPVLDTVAERANLLCRAEGSRVWLAHGGQLHPMASYGTVYGSDSQGEVLPLRTTSPVGRAFLERRCVHVEDIVPLVETEYPDTREIQARYGFRTVLTVPMLREGESVGVIALLRFQMRPFTPAEISLVQTFAAQAVIAIENVRLFNETKEALEQQTATAEILKVISSSPTDVQPVFDAIVKSGVRLFGGLDMQLRLVKGDQTEMVASTISLPGVPIPPPVPLNDERSANSRCIQRREVVQVPDVFASDWISESVKRRAEQRGFRALMCAPMLRENNAIGTIIVNRATPGPFTEKQIALLKTFAAQAVIAIENVRLFNETKEALEQQTVISEILRVISSSPTDTQPVFDAIVKSGAHLFSGIFEVSLRLVKGDLVETVASTLPIHDTGGANPAPLNDESAPAPRALRRREVVQVPDILAAEEWVGARAKQRAGQRGWRALLAAPMLRDKNAIGVIAVTRVTPGPFTDKEVALLKTFADQAVIAIENVRLFKELQARNVEVTESLEQQTATAEILKVISSSPTDIQPVFDAILENATRLCDAHMGVLGLYDGETYHRVAQRGASAEFARWLAEEGPKYPPDPRGMVRQMIAERRPIHILDRREQRAYRERNPGTVALVELGGARSSLVVPMLKEGRVVGGIIIYRPEVRAFTQKQIDLVSTFANQAVIAIENVRLFNETKEALEQQTVTADILRVISSSPTDTQPVFDAIVKSCGHLFRGMIVSLRLAKGAHAVRVASTLPFDDPEGGSVSLGDEHMPGPRAMQRREVVQVPDVLAAEEWVGGQLKKIAEKRGWRAILVTPMSRDGHGVGWISVMRATPGPFTGKEIALLRTFADQAVIAIENVRLFKEINEALERQTATSEVLKVISRSTFDLDPVLESLVDNARKLCDADRATISRADKDGNYAAVIERGLELRPELFAYMQRHPIRPDRGTAIGRAVLERRPVHIPDVQDDPEYNRRDLADLGGFRTILAVPMLREGEPIAVFVLMRTKEVRPFTEKQVELVTTFADQAVIAIENVRLFNEIQDKSRQLEVASRHKSQFLANMSHELRTPLNAILGYTELILDGIYGDVSPKVHDVMGRVDKSGRHLLGLINDVLDLSKIEAGQLTLSLGDYSLEDVVQTVFTSVGSLAAEKKLALKVALASDLPRGRGDDRRLTQVLLNLVGNAIKFTEAGEVRLEARCSDGAFVVSVADTGPGISEADQQRIFEEFQQVDDSATRKKGGTGLGLSIAKRIIELHGGRIQVESAPGRGSTFTVTLPVRVERQAGTIERLTQ